MSENVIDELNERFAILSVLNERGRIRKDELESARKQEGIPYDGILAAYLATLKTDGNYTLVIEEGGFLYLSELGKTIADHMEADAIKKTGKIKEKSTEELLQLFESIVEEEERGKGNFEVLSQEVEDELDSRLFVLSNRPPNYIADIERIQEIDNRRLRYALKLVKKIFGE